MLMLHVLRLILSSTRGWPITLTLLRISIKAGHYIDKGVEPIISTSPANPVQIGQCTISWRNVVVDIVCLTDLTFDEIQPVVTGWSISGGVTC